MENTTEHKEQESGIRYYFAQLRKHWGLTLMLALCSAAALIVYYSLQEERYTAQTELLMELNQARVADFNNESNRYFDRGVVESAMNTHREQITSRQLARTFLNDRFTEEERARIFDGYNLQGRSEAEVFLRSIINVAWIPESQIFELSATHRDPEIAAMLVNSYAENYIGALIEFRGTGAASALTFLEEQTQQLSDTIARTQAERQEFRQEHNLISVGKERELSENRIETLDKAITENRMKQMELRAVLKAIEQATDNPEALLSIPDINEYGSISELAKSLELARTERDVLAETLLDRHPDMQENEAKISSLTRALATNAATASARIQRQLAARESREQELTDNMTAQVERIRELDELAVQENWLERQLDAQQLTDAQLTKRLNETSVQSHLRDTNVRVLSEADVPLRASFPNDLAVAASASLLFGFLFIGTPLLLEIGRSKLSTFAEVEIYLNKPVLTHLEHSSKAKKRELHRQREDVKITESFRHLMAQLSLTAPDGGLGGVYVVSSTMPGEGKSLIAANMALSLAQHGRKTLLVDTDLRRPRIHEAFEMKNEQGLLTWGERSGDPADLSGAGITEVAMNLSVLCSGGCTTTPTEFIQHPAFRDLLNQLRSEYDVIILDSPPVGPCADALILGNYADQTIFVVRQNVVDRHRVRAAVRRLDKTKSPVSGIILNDTRGHSADYSYGVSRSQYGVSYGYSKTYYAPDKSARPGAIRRSERPRVEKTEPPEQKRATKTASKSNTASQSKNGTNGSHSEQKSPALR